MLRLNLVSIIIPNLHSPIVGQTLQSLEAQDYAGPFEIIVVGQDKYGQVREGGRVRAIVTPQPISPAAARNLGIRSAQGEILVFIDSDCVASRDWLRRLLGHYADPQVAVVGGGVTFPSDNYWTLCDNLATFHDYLSTAPAGVLEQLPSLNLSLRRAALEPVGFFDERYPCAAGEDADLTIRLRQQGYPLVFDPRARLTHLPQRRSASGVFKHAFNLGRFSVKVDPRYMHFLHTPRVLRSWLTAVLAAPVLAAGVVFRLLYRQVGWRYWHTLPLIYLAKLVWCAGAAQTLRAGGAFADQKRVP